MSKAKYVVINGSVGLGLIWEGESGDLMFITDGNKIDINNDIEIFTCGTQERVKIDMRDVILNAIKPKEKEKTVVNNFSFTINKDTSINDLVVNLKKIGNLN